LGLVHERADPGCRPALRHPPDPAGLLELVSRRGWSSRQEQRARAAPAAVRVWHEARVLELLGDLPAFDVPDVVAASPDPACLATRIVEGGVPLSYELVRASLPAGVDALAAELARFLASLHAPQILALARARLDDPLRIPEPGLQATTDELRHRLTPMIAARRHTRLHRWCDWVDEQLAAPAEAVFVHGDFHPDNQLWDPRELRLLLVVDFETSGVAEPEYDFRAIPSFGPGVDLLSATVDEYMALTGRRLSLERIMALHVRTTLGDALWRSEAGLPLLLPRPGGGTPDDYVDELAERLALLGVET
jgi:aminoglycoside phosphotransferase (APT) family kinase protein